MINNSDPDVDQNTLLQLQNTLKAHLASQRLPQFGAVKKQWIRHAENYFWTEDLQEFRLDDLRRYGFYPHEDRILDLAAGCGQFLLHALKNGYDGYGIEPEAWKIDFIRQRMQLAGLSDEESARIITGIGERLPFADDSFDCVTSYQTLEHVQDPKLVLKEMIRVTRIGGGVYLRCPDYRSTYEGHYQLPWLPLMPRPLARLYLRLLRRPQQGLEGIRYVTKPRILGWLSGIERDGFQLLIFDDSRIRFENILRRRGWPCLPGSYLLWRFFNQIFYIFRRESSVNLFVRVMAKQ